jgi:hypothetical protein
LKEISLNKMSLTSPSPAIPDDQEANPGFSFRNIRTAKCQDCGQKPRCVSQQCDSCRWLICQLCIARRKEENPESCGTEHDCLFSGPSLESAVTPPPADRTGNPTSPHTPVASRLPDASPSGSPETKRKGDFYMESQPERPSKRARSGTVPDANSPKTPGSKLKANRAIAASARVAATLTPEIARLSLQHLQPSATYVPKAISTTLPSETLPTQPAAAWRSRNEATMGISTIVNLAHADAIYQVRLMDGFTASVSASTISIFTRLVPEDHSHAQEVVNLTYIGTGAAIAPAPTAFPGFDRRLSAALQFTPLPLPIASPIATTAASTSMSPATQRLFSVTTHKDFLVTISKDEILLVEQRCLSGGDFLNRSTRRINVVIGHILAMEMDPGVDLRSGENSDPSLVGGSPEVAPVFFVEMEVEKKTGDVEMKDAGSDGKGKERAQEDQGGKTYSGYLGTVLNMSSSPPA